MSFSFGLLTPGKNDLDIWRFNSHLFTWTLSLSLSRRTAAAYNYVCLCTEMSCHNFIADKSS